MLHQQWNALELWRHMLLPSAKTICQTLVHIIERQITPLTDSFGFGTVVFQTLQQLPALKATFFRIIRMRQSFLHWFGKPVQSATWKNRLGICNREAHTLSTMAGDQRCYCVTNSQCLRYSVVMNRDAAINQFAWLHLSYSVLVNLLWW